MAKQGKVPAAPMPPDSELLAVQPSAADSETRERLRIIAATRACQRGVESHEQLLMALLTGLPAKAQDYVDVLDVHGHAGDFALATVHLRTAGKLPCRVRHFLVNIEGVRTGVDSTFAVKRPDLIWQLIVHAED